MERSKWEDEFKEKLNQRNITPTPHAWERLDAMLNQAEDNEGETLSTTDKPVRKLSWLYIAAGIAVFLMMATLFFSQKDEQRNEVVIEEKQPIAPESVVIPAESVQNDKHPIQTEVAVRETTTPRYNTGNNVGQQKMDKAMKAPHKQVTEPLQQFAVENPVVENQMPVIENKAGTTPETQIAATENKTQKGVKVDPKSLLSQVDGELDMTFREKTIKSISRKYKNVKVALANRNNQE